MGVMMLAAGKGSSVLIEAEGADADAGARGPPRADREKFGEGE